MKAYEKVEICVMQMEEDVFCGNSGEGWRVDENDDYNDPNFGSNN